MCIYIFIYVYPSERAKNNKNLSKVKHKYDVSLLLQLIHVCALKTTIISVVFKAHTWISCSDKLFKEKNKTFYSVKYIALDYIAIDYIYNNNISKSLWYFDF